MVAPPRNSASTGARLSLQNARRHRAGANLLASEGHYGLAVSHLVLATEEAIKSISFLVIALGLRLPEPDVRKILTNHRARHLLAAASQVIASFTPSAVAAIKDAMGDEIPPDPQLLLGMMTDQFRGFQSYLEGPHDPMLLREIEWWQSADRLKQRGLYADYSGGEWQTPDAIAEDEFVLATNIVDGFFSQLEAVFVGWIEAPADDRQLFSEWFAPVLRELENGMDVQLSNLLFGRSA
jgi:AbiV family abortive infection protein